MMFHMSAVTPGSWNTLSTSLTVRPMASEISTTLNPASPPSRILAFRFSSAAFATPMSVVDEVAILVAMNDTAQLINRNSPIPGLISEMGYE